MELHLKMEDLKNLFGTNTLAYFAPLTVKSQKRFYNIDAWTKLSVVGAVTFSIMTFNITTLSMTISSTTPG